MEQSNNCSRQKEAPDTKSAANSSLGFLWRLVDEVVDIKHGMSYYDEMTAKYFD